MIDFFSEFLAAFIPLFVTIDPFGLIPLFLAVTQPMTPQRRRRTSFQAVGAALIIALSFMFLGDAIFRFVGITRADFRIAGGVLLLVLAVLDLVAHGKPAVHEDELAGIVPLAMPLITGPATLTTLLVLAQRHGYAMTTLGLVANLALLLACLLTAQQLARIIGINALRAFSKLVMVLLAAIAVNLIRMGVVEVLGEIRD